MGPWGAVCSPENAVDAQLEFWGGEIDNDYRPAKNLVCVLKKTGKRAVWFVIACNPCRVRVRILVTDDGEAGTRGCLLQGDYVLSLVTQDVGQGLSSISGLVGSATLQVRINWKTSRVLKIKSHAPSCR